MAHVIFTILFVCILNACSAADVEIDKESIEYYQYSKQSNDNDSEPIKLDRAKFNAVQFNTSSSVKVLIHGYGENSSACWILGAVKNYLSVGVTNIVAVDWSKYSRNNNYIDAYVGAKAIGAIIGEDLDELSEQQKISLAKFHVIGESFGAHLAGFAGKYIKSQNSTLETHTTESNSSTNVTAEDVELTSNTTILGRITGLDPSGPLFVGLPPSRRLDRHDALFVDVIHTYMFIGYMRPLGTADFWPNGGLLQPGCKVFSFCSHERAGDYFVESICSSESQNVKGTDQSGLTTESPRNSTDDATTKSIDVTTKSIDATTNSIDATANSKGGEKFTAWQCESDAAFNSGKCKDNPKTVMGEYVDLDAKGDYFLKTNSEEPYACSC